MVDKDNELRKQIFNKVVNTGTIVLVASNMLNKGEITRTEYNRRLEDILFPGKTDEILKLIKERESKLVLETTEEIRYQIMRGEHGHDEVTIVKSLDQSINQLTNERES